MCGRFSNNVNWTPELTDLLGEWPTDAHISYNVAPTLLIPTFTKDGGHAMRWGLIPSWSKEPRSKYATFNARIETINQKPAYRDSWKQGKRCVIPVQGYYEWKMIDGQKQPYYIHPANNEPLFLGGIWDNWNDELLSCTIITQAASAGLDVIHDRMPILIIQDELSDWLSDKPFTGNMPSMKYYPVSTRVNNVRNNSPANLERI